MFTKLKNQLGQSVLELMIAMSIFVLVVSGIMFLVLDAQTANRQGGERTKAAFLTQEAFEATQSIANQGWRNFMDGDYGLDNSGGIWEWLGNSNVFNQFTRRITVASVYRDGNGDTVESGGTIDLDSKKITVKTIWDFTTGRPSEVTLETILTNWHSTKWKQTTQAEFDVGTKNQVETTSTDDGEIQLGSAGVSSFTEWTFDTPAEYTYVPTDIEVVGSSAQLVSSGGGFSSGGTTNGSFDAVLTPWSYNDWDQTGGEVNINGLWDSPGGNPAGYAKIEIPRGKSDELGGFFEHSFVVSNNNPDIGTLDFDYSVITFDPSFNPANDSFEVLAFIDTASGAPTPGTHVWASGQISGTSSYTSVNVDISPYITTSGTYYVKLAVWITTGSQNRGPFDLGFDNAVVYWEKSGGSSSYPTTNPTIEPITSFSSPDIDAWTGFQETAAKNGGEIYYQLSDDDSATWQYWNGSAWATVAGATDYNIATEVNTNIPTFSATTQQIMFKAFLSSDGTQLVVLDNVRATYDAINIFDSTFDTPAEYTYVPTDIEVVGSSAQLVSSGGGFSSGGTINPGFDSTLTPWQYNDWDQGGGEVDATGIRQSSGGNPGAYTMIQVPRGSRDELGGYFEQSFNVTENNPDTAYVQFDSRVLDFNGNPNVAQIYIFLDSTSGAPNVGTEIWSSGPLSSTTSWSSTGPIDITSLVATTGTYYLKLAVWVETGSSQAGQFRFGFDNAVVYWEKSGGSSSYPTTNPTIEPITSFSSPDIDAWTGFQETAAKNGGEIYYQLSDDDSATWQYWNGSAWATVAGATDYNIATEVNTNIPTFSATTQQIMFKAFLSSDGTQLVILDNVNIEYSKSGGVGYFMAGDFISQSHDTGSEQTIYNYIDWTADIPVGTQLQWQLRTADSEANLAAATWVGSDGTGSTFYSTPGEIIEVDPLTSGIRWIQYKAYLSGDSISTPIIYDVIIDYED